MLVAPTEPPILKELGTVSLVPEEYGCDFLLTSPVWGLVGVQRKEVKDLIASVKDGRLAKELGQMQRLRTRLLIVEGQTRWTNDGVLLSQYGTWTQAQHHGTLWSVQLHGCWTSSTNSVSETSKLLSLFQGWTRKDRHSSLTTRPKTLVRDEWGGAGNREWGIHFWQSFRGIGPETAASLYDSVGVPIEWTIGLEDLLQVKGVGKVRAKELLRAFSTGEVGGSSA